MNTRRAQRGLSLVEILVALAVSAVLMAGVVQIFISTRQSYGVLDDFSRIQENGRFVLDYVGRIVRQAGYVGCSTGTIGSITNTLNSTDQFEWNFAEAIRGYEYAGTAPGETYTIASATPAACGAACDTSAWTTRNDLGATENAPLSVTQFAVAGSDILGIRGAFDGGVPVIKNNSSATLFVADIPSLNAGSCPEPFDTTTMYSGLCEGDILVVSDCSKSRIYQATNVNAPGGEIKTNHDKGGDSDCPDTDGNYQNSYCPGNAISSWGGSSAPDEEQFGTDSFVLKMKTFAFFVGVGESGRSALFQRINNGNPEELVENVESMQVLYGVDTDGNGDANRYRTADQVDNFDESVVSVRLSLLLSGADPVAPGPDQGNYDLSGTTVNPVADNRLRRRFTTVIRLRNRGLQ